MTYPWEKGAAFPQSPPDWVKAVPVVEVFTPPWDWERRNPLLVKNPVTGLWPGQKHPLDIPQFLRRTS